MGFQGYKRMLRLRSIITMLTLLCAIALAQGKESKCGGKSFNPETQFCHDNKIFGKCGWEEYNPQYRVCNEGRWLSFLNKAKIVKKRIDEYGFASEKLSEFLVKGNAQCLRYRQTEGSNWKNELDSEFKKMDLSFVVYDLGNDEDAELSLVKENGKWKVFHVGHSMQCQ